MKKVVIGNMKMNILSPAERERYLSLLKKELRNFKTEKTELALCPPYVHLEGFKKKNINKIKLGAQNMFWEKEGSFTGEISPVMLKNVGCEYVILGHSERRRYFSERGEEINLKLLVALKNNIQPILCVGENESQREKSATVVMKQLQNGLKDVSRSKIEKVIICYEPVWAISSNNPNYLPTTNEIMSARLLIKKFLVEKYDLKTAEKVKIIYGGSVSPKTVQQSCVDSGMEGALIGRASLKPLEFIKIAKIINNQ